MKYNTSKAIGDAGESLLGYLIPYLHNCIYRQSIIDIGIDGEIEIIENELSTGNFIKVQVKSTDDDDFRSNKILYQIDEAHIEYWAKLSIPVLLCRVFLKSRLVYCIPVNDDLRILESTTEGKINIDFTDSFMIDDEKFIEYITKYAKSKNIEIKSHIVTLMKDIEQRVSDIPSYNNPLLFDPSEDYTLVIQSIKDDLLSIENTIETFKVNDIYPEINEEITNYYRHLNVSLRTIGSDNISN